MRWLVATGLLAVVLQAAACSAARREDDLADCKAAEARLHALRTGAPDTKSAEAARVIETCMRAHRNTGSDDALFIATRTQLAQTQYDAVIAAAGAAPPDSDIAPRLWVLAGEAELYQGRSSEARAWYEKALDLQASRDPLRAANTAARIADLERSRGALDEAIRFQQRGQTLAAAAGDGDLHAFMTLALTEILLDVGDLRAAAAALASMTDQVRPSSTFYGEYLATAGEVDAADGRPQAAAASFQLCVRDERPDADPATQTRCHVGLAALAIAAGGPDDAAALAHLARADGYLGFATKLFGPDPDRAADLAWLRALVELRGDPARAAAALAGLEAFARDVKLGSGTRSRISFTIGHTLAAAGKTAEAETWFVAAARAVEELRDGGHHREVRRSLPRELRAPYEALFVLRHRAGNPRGALEAMESALARDFVDQLAASVAGSSDPTTGDDRIGDAGRRARALRDLNTRPAVAFDPAAGAGATIIGFFAAEGRLWRARVVASEVAIVEVGTLAQLAPLVRSVRADPSAAAARELRRRLLPDDVLPPREQLLVLVPDPFLEGVRFAALPDGGHFLIERHPVVLAPTFAVAAGSAGPGPGPLGPPVVLGDPESNLAAARDEASEVAGLLEVAPTLGAGADRRAIATARRARVLHVASHGRTRGDGTILLLADGELSTADVLELGLAPELVVVASCTSAAARRDAMWTSIAAAFLANGTGTVVGATASIPDAIARDIVVELHRHARDVGPAVGLARALRAAIARGVPVRSWSPFAVLGRAPRAVINE
jgi:tetratricopeptide (TPR) repeat protein